MVKFHTNVKDQAQLIRTHHLQTLTTATHYHHLQNKHLPLQLRNQMGPEMKLFVRHHIRTHETLMDLMLNTDISWLLRMPGNLLREAICGTPANTLNKHISRQMNILVRCCRELLRTWMLNVSMVVLLMMTDLQIHMEGMEMRDGRCLPHPIRRNGRETSAIEPRRAV